MNNRSAPIRTFLNEERRRQANRDSSGLPRDETIDSSLFTPNQMARLRESDPFSYYSIVTARLGTSYVDLDAENRNICRGSLGDGDAGAGGVPRHVRIANYRNRRSSYQDTVLSRNPVSRTARRSSMPDLEATSIQDEHHVAAPTVVKRRTRFATESDACTALGRWLEDNGSAL